MFTTLTLPPGSSLNFSPPTFRSDRCMFFVSRRPVICAAVAEASPEESLYEVLRVKRDASIREIKAAYRSMAKLYHPDVSEEEEDDKDFIEIHEAYETLSDPEARAEYDMALGARRRPIMRCKSGPEYVRARAGFHTTRRWETDQCW